MTTTLARHRLRPVPWRWLAVFAAGWFLLAGLLATGAADPGVGIGRFRPVTTARSSPATLPTGPTRWALPGWRKSSPPSTDTSP
jgi:hypothetical protein